MCDSISHSTLFAESIGTSKLTCGLDDGRDGLGGTRLGGLLGESLVAIEECFFVIHPENM
jgi:hypothetical protein